MVLPKLDEPILTSEAVFSGWGFADMKPGQDWTDMMPTKLQRANMRIITIAECYDALEGDPPNQNKLEIPFNICTKPLNPGPTVSNSIFQLLRTCLIFNIVLQICLKDSGSPLGRWEGDKFIQLGIAAWAPLSRYMCIPRDTPVMYTRVAAYTDWIRENSACIC